MEFDRLVKCFLACTLIALVSAGAAGCRAGGLALPGMPGGSLRVASLGETPLALSGRFPTAVYADHSVETSFFLSDAPIEQILDGTMRNGQIVHVELLWTPRAGYTPIEDSATNASIRYIIFAEGEMGIYGGAGFARLRGKPGARRFGMTIRDASLALIESTDGFNDLLTPARMTGAFNAKLDNHATRQVQHAVSQRVTNKLGRSRIVDANEKTTDLGHPALGYFYPWALAFP